MNRLFPVAILALLPACAFLEADLESDPRWMSLTYEVEQRSLEIYELVEENKRLYDEIEAEGLSADHAAAIAGQLADNLAKIAELNEWQQTARIDLDTIAEEYEIPEWQLWLSAAGSVLFGMGVPTSGPLAGVLAGLAPFLERFGIRNGRRRKEWHLKQDESEQA